MKKPTVDLKMANPAGRVDVLAYRGLEYLTRQFEANQGMAGIWDNLEPHAQKVVNHVFDGFELPVEAQIMLNIFHANMNRLPEGEKK